MANPILNAIQSLFPGLDFRGWTSSYDNAQQSSRRGLIPGAPIRDARRDLTPSTRKELVRRARYLARNSGFVRELVANMATYSIGDGIRAQAQSQDADWNARAERYFRDWSSRCEVTGRFSWEEVQHLVCRAIDVDGEIFVLKTRDRYGLPSLQLVETHRVGGEEYGTDAIDGIIMDRFGAPAAYRVVEDVGYRDVPANSLCHIYEPEAASAIRCAPVIQHSINHVVDEMELLALEKHAVKDNCDITRILKADAALDEGTDFAFVDSSEQISSSDPASLQQITGGKVVALKPHESLESFQPSRPSPTFTGFLEHLRRDTALGVLPYEFAADPSKVGGASTRLVIAKADRRFQQRQNAIINRLIKPIWFYVIGDAISNGQLPATADWWRISAVTPRRVTADAGREAQANREDVIVGLKTLSDHYEELGADFSEELRRRARDMRLVLDVAAEFGVPAGLLWQPATPPPMPALPLPG